MIAVLTGDIVYSTSSKETKTWLNVMKAVFKALEKQYSMVANGAEMHRGDGFQLGLNNPTRALEVALLIRAGLIKEPSLKTKMDTRIAIGIGEYEYLGKSINESSGDVFQRSGHALDQLKNGADCLALSSPNTDFNEEMKASLTLADTLIKGWSKADAEIAWYNWMAEWNQAEVAERLGISQPAVSKRRKRAHIEELDLLLTRFKNKVRALHYE